jgi:hypothetical protein
MKRHAILILLLTILSIPMLAQSGFEEIIKGTPADAKYLAEGYIKPFMKAFGEGINNGWYNSGAPHKLGGFDLTLSSANVFVPQGDYKYFVDNSKMTNVELLSGSGATATAQNGDVPTFFGGDLAPTYRSPKGASALSARFNGPVGLGLTFLPTPSLGLGIGLPLGFEVKVRYVPTLNMSQLSERFSGSFDLFGIGLMHDVKQWIPGIKAMPFDISAFVGYTKLKLDLGYDPADATKRGDFSCTATTIQGLISKKLSVLTVYAGVGYNIANTTMGLKGNYDMNDDGDTIDAGEKDPFTIATESSGMRATLGLRLRLAIIAFHGDYTVQSYGRTITGGFGINFR